MNEKQTEVKLNEAQQKFLDFYLAQKDAVNNLIQDCVFNNKKILELEQKLNEQNAIYQKVMNENQQIKLNLNRTSEAKSKSEHHQQFLENNLRISNKVNLDLKLNIERLMLEMNQLKNEKEYLIRERNELASEKNVFYNQKLILEKENLKAEIELNESNTKLAHLTQEQEKNLKAINDLEANLNSKEKEIQEIKRAYAETQSSKKLSVDEMEQTVDTWVNYMKTKLGFKKPDSRLNESYISDEIGSNLPSALISFKKDNQAIPVANEKAEKVTRAISIERNRYTESVQSCTSEDEGPKCSKSLSRNKSPFNAEGNLKFCHNF